SGAAANAVRRRAAAARRGSARPFDPAPAGWGASARLIGTGHRPVRHERVGVSVTRTSGTACELRIVPHSTHAARWSGSRLRRYFRLAHAAADALAARLATPLDSPAPGASTLQIRTSAKEEMTHGVHS